MESTTTPTIPKNTPKKPNRGGGPLAYYQKDYIMHLGVLGNTRAQIREKFIAKYSRPVNPRTISRIWKENKEQMDEAQNSIASQGMDMVTGDSLKQRSYKIMDRRLHRAETDESEIEKLRVQLRAGEITKQQFNASCAQYEQLTINELVKVAAMGFEHSQKGKEGPALTPEDQAALSLITEGLKSGNPFQLIQVLNPKVYPNGDNPESLADI